MVGALYTPGSAMTSYSDSSRVVREAMYLESLWVAGVVLDMDGRHIGRMM